MELGLVAEFDRKHLIGRQSDPSLVGRVKSFETAFGMQQEAPGELRDVQRQGLGAAVMLVVFVLKRDLAVLQRARTTSGSSEAQRQARQQALEDMMWALLTSKEFLFSH